MGSGRHHREERSPVQLGHEPAQASLPWLKVTSSFARLSVPRPHNTHKETLRWAQLLKNSCCCHSRATCPPGCCRAGPSRHQPRGLSEKGTLILHYRPSTLVSPHTKPLKATTPAYRPCWDTEGLPSPGCQELSLVVKKLSLVACLVTQ